MAGFPPPPLKGPYPALFSQSGDAKLLNHQPEEQGKTSQAKGDPEGWTGTLWRLVYSPAQVAAVKQDAGPSKQVLPVRRDAFGPGSTRNPPKRLPLPSPSTYIRMNSSHQ